MSDTPSTPENYFGSNSPNTMSSSSDSLRSSSSSDDETARDSFKVRLYNDFKQRALLPKLPNLGQGSRWILINTRENETYKVEMLDQVAVFELKRGWSILVDVENLQAGDKLMFHVLGDNAFHMSIHSPPNHPPPIGFSPERIPAVPIDNIGVAETIVNGEVPQNALVSQAIQRVWNASSLNGPLYVCRLLISPTNGKCFIFNKPYSSLIPKNHSKIAMRFVGSHIIIPGAIRTYTDGNARMVKEWPSYAALHNLRKGEVFVCKIVRGPAVWEFIGSCARRGR